MLLYKFLRESIDFLWAESSDLLLFLKISEETKRTYDNPKLDRNTSKRDNHIDIQKKRLGTGIDCLK